MLDQTPELTSGLTVVSIFTDIHLLQDFGIVIPFH
jgi:hypothetical protein